VVQKLAKKSFDEQVIWSDPLNAEDYQQVHGMNYLKL
jgi:hypothetical protein